MARFIVMVALLAGTVPDDDRRPLVPAVERFDDMPAVEAGRLLLGELGCIACHAADDPSITLKKAPILSDVGSRLKPDWLRRWLADPHATKPGTTMPQVAPKEAVEPLLHYLMSLAKPVSFAAGASGKGADLHRSVGCVACHAPLDGGAGGDKAVVPIGDPAAKYRDPAALAAFLHDPLKWRPSGRMPKLNLTPQEAMAVAVRLAGLPAREPDEPGATAPGLLWEVYEGQWSKLPDFDALAPAGKGVAERFDIRLGKRDDHFAMRFRGYLEVEKDGLYTFRTKSDDGSRLWIGRTVVVDNDGTHGAQDAEGTIELKAGRHALTVGYFDASGGEELDVQWEGPGFKRQPIPGRRLSHPTSGTLAIREGSTAAAFIPDAALVAKGREIFRAQRCASCHVAEPAVTSPAAKPLTEIRQAACRAAVYPLSARQRSAIEAALAAGPDRDAAPAKRIDRTMSALNCYACHERGKKGGPEAGRNAFFVGQDQTIGDEGRLPPHLDGVGAKLRPDFLKQVLAQGTKVRPYVMTRMPAFGDAVAGLADEFLKADGATPETASKPRDKDAIKNGRLLAGTKGLSCVSCHMFQGHKSLGIPGMDLVHMSSRLRRDWFEKYLREPATLRPGTRMPTFWPEGKAVLKTVCDGNTDAQIDALWHYLAEGPKAPVPVGIGPQPILLVPQAEPILYRNFIQGAGTRAIAVGYPEGVHLAWDANQMVPKLLWKGDFLDASKHWVDRGPGFQAPAGDDVLKLPDGPPLAVLPDAKAPWPKEAGKAAGFRFRGYRLDGKGRPEFMYEFKGVAVVDAFEPAAGAFKRTLTLEAKDPPAGLHVRLGDQVQAVVFKDGRATITYTYAW
ncbi:MAG TPA: PA14 domain-containing protein [Planctomycetota bacterium]|nr:PA14 domain-containing protein [Planctomycetota bacterium]